MRIRTGDVLLEVVVDGAADAPPLLLMHGILGSSRTWEWSVPRLTDRYRVLRLDFRGHGASDRAPGAYQPVDYLSDAVAVCEQVAGVPCIVIGHSLGGVTAAALAQTRPELVRGVVLEDAPLRMLDTAAVGSERNALLDTFMLLRDAIPQFQAAGMSVEALAAVMAAAPAVGGGLLGEVLHEDALTTMAAGMLCVDASVLDRVVDGTIEAVFDPTVPLAMPVAVVAADPASPDAATRPDDLAQLATTSPHVTAHTLAGANHLIHDTLGQREPFWSIVSDFLESLSG